MRFIFTALLLCFASPAMLGAANGDPLTGWVSNGVNEYRIWIGLDAEDEVVAAGTAIRIQTWEKLSIIPQANVDAGDTYEVECGVSGTETAPTVWEVVVAADGDMAADHIASTVIICEWARINKPTDTDGAIDVWLMVVRRKLR